MWHHPRLTEEQLAEMCLELRQIVTYERMRNPNAYPCVEITPLTPEERQQFPWLDPPENNGDSTEAAETTSLSESDETGDVQLLKTDAAPESSP